MMVRVTGDQTAQRLADAYLKALGSADLRATIFAALFSDTAEARLTLRGVTHGAKADGTALVSIWFHFDWRLPSGRKAPFEVIDMMELADDGRIASLHIVYDTAQVRPAFEQETGKQSWRADAQAI
jgi:hypothetical protein